ncbi:Zinc finger CCCH domain-containing protein 22 [Zea mays]|uniref:Zinc finger CCCH domain-containing protein 22 n=1 Tax=Zea mays TaxID=4577 RepID=A0A3L6DNJ7_MAIZE|nr:Zinc finger CCCH domain-containing protein 22 [Zea mays]
MASLYEILLLLCNILLLCCVPDKLHHNISYFKDKGSDEVVFKAMGRAINKTVMVVELIKELELLSDGANVYKLIGPVLVKHDLAKTKANVKKHIEYISAELKRMDRALKDLKEKQNNKKESVCHPEQGNPHFVCDVRVLVKPYKEKGKVPGRFRKLQHAHHGGAEFAGCASPTGLLDSRDPYALLLLSGFLLGMKPLGYDV